jgi:hypothetical protein
MKSAALKRKGNQLIEPSRGIFGVSRALQNTAVGGNMGACAESAKATSKILLQVTRPRLQA